DRKRLRLVTMWCPRRPNVESSVPPASSPLLKNMLSRPSKPGAVACTSLGRTLWTCSSRARRNAAIIMFFAIASLAGAQNQVSEYDVKAAYLFIFGKFVRFMPADEVTRRQSFDICLVGEHPLGQTLDELTANEQLESKPVRVVKLKSAAEARGCAIAYVSASEGTRIGPDLDALRGQAILTVSD